MKRLLLLLTFVLVVLSSARARASAPPERYEISVLTISPGDPVFFRFGHNALVVHDKVLGKRWVFNWGTFSFEEPHLVEKFLRGRLTYWLSVQSYEATKWHYRHENRWIVEQKLRLTRDQKLRLVRMVWENAKPENRKYRYDYYRDNCSTRIRDVLDRVLDGGLRNVSRGPAKMTFRQQTSRLVADIWWAYLALNLAMGDYIDQPITEWDEMFVPMKLRDMLRKVTVRDDLGRNVPLVMEERTIVHANRKDPPARPPNRIIPLLLLGLVMGAGFGAATWWFFSWARGEGKAPWKRRLALSLPLLFWTVLTGFFSFMFLFFWTATDHKVAYHNENLLLMNPLTMALPVAAIGLLWDSEWARKVVRWVLLISAGLAALELVLKILPWFDQANGEMIAWLLPLWLGAAVGVVLGERKAGTRNLASGSTSARQSAPSEREKETGEQADEREGEEETKGG